VNETRQGKFVNGQVKSFAAKGRKQAADVIISDALSAKFDIEEKEYLPADGDGIIWITNVGLKPKGSDTDVTEYYEVQFSHAGIFNEVLSVYIFVNGAVQELAASEYHVNHAKKKVHVRLNLIDPPVGSGGR
jgi:hypothetical protein